MSDPLLPAAFYDPAINDPPADPDVVLASSRGTYAKEEGIRAWLLWKLAEAGKEEQHEDDPYA